MTGYSDQELLLVKRYVKTHLAKGQSLKHIKEQLRKVGVKSQLVDASLKHTSHAWVFWPLLIAIVAFLAAYLYYVGKI